MKPGLSWLLQVAVVTTDPGFSSRTFLQFLSCVFSSGDFSPLPCCIFVLLLQIKEIQMCLSGGLRLAAPMGHDSQEHYRFQELPRLLIPLRSFTCGKLSVANELLK